MSVPWKLSANHVQLPIEGRPIPHCRSYHVSDLCEMISISEPLTVTVPVVRPEGIAHSWIGPFPQKNDPVPPLKRIWEVVLNVRLKPTCGCVLNVRILDNWSADSASNPNSLPVKSSVFSGNELFE